MRNMLIALFFLYFIAPAHAANDLDTLRQALQTSVEKTNTALNDVRNACMGIYDELNSAQTLTKIGTGASVLGALSSAVATGTGIAKNKQDSIALNATPYDAEWQLWATQSRPETDNEQIEITEADITNLMDRMAAMDTQWSDEYLQEFRQNTDAGKRGKTLGDVRTGTLATGAAANIAGATAAGVEKSKTTKTLSQKIEQCMDTVEILNRTLLQTKLDKSAYAKALGTVKDADKNDAEKIITQQYVLHLDNIVRICSQWDTNDAVQADKNATGALTSNIVGTSTGIAGTVTSAMANSDAMHLSGDKKEQQLNTTANLLAGGTTIASAIATIYNTVQANVIKRMSTIASQCQEALK